jgi:hypothetical protein
MVVHPITQERLAILHIRRDGQLRIVAPRLLPVEARFGARQLAPARGSGAGDHRWRLKIAYFQRTLQHAVAAFGPLEKELLLLADLDDNPTAHPHFGHIPFLAVSGTQASPSAVAVPMHSLCGPIELRPNPLPWARRLGVAVWRGRLHGSLPLDGAFSEGLSEIPRRIALRLSAERPDLFLASTVRVPLSRLHEHKYIVALSGFCWSGLLRDALAMGGCVLLQEQRAVAWYQAYMRPWEHYIPVKFDLSDLFEKIEWARNHDDECEEITRKALEFAGEHLSELGAARHTALILAKLQAWQGSSASSLGLARLLPRLQAERRKLRLPVMRGT